MADAAGQIVTVRATEHLDATGSLVGSALQLAQIVVDQRKCGHALIVSFKGLKGASSSYFNVLLHHLQDHDELGTLGSELKLEFDTAVQQSIFDRSLASVTRQAAARQSK